MTPALHRFLAISGDLGSGKSTVTKLLATALGWRSMSTGEMQRSIAASRNLTTLELNHLSEQDFSVDEAVDAALKDLSQGDDRVIFDSRMAWLFVAGAYSIHVTVRPDVGDGRLLKRSDQETERYSTSAEAQSQRLSRANSERERFRTFYNVDIQKLRNYRVVVDSTTATPEMIVEVLEDLYRSKGAVPDVVLRLSPQNILPSDLIQTLRDLDQSSIEVLSADKFLDQNPIEVIYSYPYFMVVDGHKRLSAALIAGKDLIPARLVAEGSELVYGSMTADQLFASSLRWSLLYDWESAHSIDYGLDRQVGYLPSR